MQAYDSHSGVGHVPGIYRFGLLDEPAESRDYGSDEIG
jgi:hypothetical protein